MYEGHMLKSEIGISNFFGLYGGVIMKVIVATKNPGKVLGVQKAFVSYFGNFEIEGIPVSSGVGDQPINEDIQKGARGRVSNLITYAKERDMEADYYVAIESGITNLFGGWMNVSMAFIQDRNGYIGFGMSPGYPVPNRYIEEIKNTSMGQVMDRLFKQHNSGDTGGGIQMLTRNQVTRIDLTKDACLMALLPFLNSEIWALEKKEEN